MKTHHFKLSLRTTFYPVVPLYANSFLRYGMAGEGQGLKYPEVRETRQRVRLSRLFMNGFVLFVLMDVGSRIDFYH